ncbi:MAG: hypothetical protein E6G39_04015 [Actinobacteria bacterium]|nr:MAG: hypothetical protein E6G39_04015 [Actinomycetota bacterium]
MRAFRPSSTIRRRAWSVTRRATGSNLRPTPMPAPMPATTPDGTRRSGSIASGIASRCSDGAASSRS